MAKAPSQAAAGSAARASGMIALPAWFGRVRGLIVPVSIVAMLAVIIVPLPTWLMDVLICLNISLSVVILMTTIYMKEPLEFSVFPSLLLGTTLARLVLNIATTRLILSADAATPEEAMGVAGQVIMAFGTFVAGSSLYVGLIIFIILVVVQFIVITKGATRISEVAARFTLDAMPGKQLAIDADLNAGTIDEKEARRRRERIGQEADFFGAMDGASKFVRGDAIAGIIITLVNIAGGIAIGVIDRSWPLLQTANTFTKLTIGDGLVSQLPALVISIASALIVTRSGAKDELGGQVTGQLTSQPTGLYITSGFLFLLAFTGLPMLPLIVTSAGLAGTAWMLHAPARAASKAAAAAPAAALKPEPPAPESLLKLDAIELEVGYGLVALVDANQGGDLLDRISAIRRQLVVELGVILPPVRIRDNLQLGANDYRFKVRSAVVARSLTYPGRFLAIDSGISTGPIEGEEAREPAFGLPARWIEPAHKSRAEAMNYTVVDAASVLATHLTEIARTYAPELLTRQEVTELVAQLKTKAPKLVEECIPTLVKTSDLHRVLQNLLAERVSIRDLEAIVETMADWMPKTKDIDVVTEYVRNALRRTICQQYGVAQDEPSPSGAPGMPAPSGTGRLKVTCCTLDPALEDLINSYIDRSPAGTSLTMPPGVAGRVVNQLQRGLDIVTRAGHQPVVLASPQVRAVVRQLLAPQLPAVAVLGYNEIASNVDVESLALVTPPAPASTQLTAVPSAADAGQPSPAAPPANARPAMAAA